LTTRRIIYHTFTLHFLIRKRLGVSLCPTDARLISPKFRGELVSNPTLFIGSLDDPACGTAAASDYHIQEGRQVHQRNDYLLVRPYVLALDLGKHKVLCAEVIKQFSDLSR
jgi:hypothetical protein